MNGNENIPDILHGISLPRVFLSLSFACPNSVFLARRLPQSPFPLFVLFSQWLPTNLLSIRLLPYQT